MRFAMAYRHEAITGANRSGSHGPIDSWVSPPVIKSAKDMEAAAADRAAMTGSKAGILFALMGILRGIVG